METSVVNPWAFEWSDLMPCPVTFVPEFDPATTTTTTTFAKEQHDDDDDHAAQDWAISVLEEGVLRQDPVFDLMASSLSGGESSTNEDMDDTRPGAPASRRPRKRSEKKAAKKREKKKAIRGTTKGEGRPESRDGAKVEKLLSRFTKKYAEEIVRATPVDPNDERADLTDEPTVENVLGAACVLASVAFFLRKEPSTARWLRSRYEHRLRTGESKRLFFRLARNLIRLGDGGPRSAAVASNADAKFRFSDDLLEPAASPTTTVVRRHSRVAESLRGRYEEEILARVVKEGVSRRHALWVLCTVLILHESVRISLKKAKRPSELRCDETLEEEGDA